MFQIRSLVVIPVSVPLKKPVKMAGITVLAAENIVVRVTDDTGAVGWGEAASAPTMNGETMQGMLAAVQFMSARLEGAEITDPAQAATLIGGAIHGNPGAKSAVEIALLDLMGKRTRQPLHALLGGSRRDRAPVLSFIAGGTLDEELAQARALVGQGFVALKVKIGLADALTDLARCRAVRDAVGDGVRISADANQGYSRAEALAFMAGAAQAGLDFVEQPIAAGDIDGMRLCAEASTVPVAADEGFQSIASIQRHHDAGAAAGGSLKTIKLGGCLAVMEAGHLMQRLNMRVNLAGKTAETTIASAAIAHLGLALPQIDWDVSVTSPYLTADVTAQPLEVIDGHVAPHDGPGLGIEVDEAMLAKVTLPAS